MKTPFIPILGFILSALTWGCGASPNVEAAETKPDAAIPDQPLLVSLPPERTGINFSNPIMEDADVNFFHYEYLYNGGGVAVGDLNNDGLVDVYFTGTLNPDKVYLNRGGMKFEDVTSKVLPTKHEGWHSGVNIVDVNNDGWLDIHVSRSGWYEDTDVRKNLLYINKGGIEPGGVPAFQEQAEAFGIADTGRTTQSAFFDYDADGDLDLYVMNCPLQAPGQLTSLEVDALIAANKAPTDQFYRNDGGHYVNVSKQAGIQNMAYGLGLVISDLNGDDRPDIYVANDYIAPDFMYLNNGNGTFTERVKETTRHISNFAMGTDAADFNNDGLPDIMTVDMVSEDHVRSKKNMGAMSSDKFWGVVKVGYHYQYMFNTLQMNNGNGTFSEVAQQAGVSKTDWSWTPMLADLDNDGWKDLVITNGYKRDMRDKDYMDASDKLKNEKQVSLQQIFSLVPSNRIRDYAYRNKGLDESGMPSLAFEDVSEAWGFKQSANSNGATYADLDNDGDLDIIFNNIDAVAEVFENQAVQQGKGHWLRVQVEGDGGKAYGAKLTLRTSQGEQFQELMPTRGYQGGVDRILHFGLGAATSAAELLVRWPDGKESRFADVKADQIFKVERATAKDPLPLTIEPKLLAESTPTGLVFKHVENTYDDFLRERLLPHKQSELGPLVSVGDANGDGLDDLFIGGARGQTSALFVQNANVTFAKGPSQPWTAHAICEDLGSLFFDADGDGDQDLYVVSGSNEVDQDPRNYNNRLYRNDGSGNFKYDPNSLPELQTSAMRVCAADIDGDKDLDLFVGGRVIPGEYPNTPRSYLLLNDGGGTFSDATETLAPDMLRMGLVSDAEFYDYDSDGDADLIAVGEWMPISFFENTGGRFAQATDKSGLKDTEGWRSSLTVADLDGDGDKDLVCGNIGWNSKFHAKPDHPLDIYWNDFDGNGHNDIVLAKDYKGKVVPVRGRQCSSEQCPMIANKFETYDAFAKATLGQIYGDEKLAKALHLQAKHMRSCVVMNLGKGKWELRDLPGMAQSAPINGSVVMDVDNDGHMDILAVGNNWGAEVETIRYDGGTGCVLLGDGKGGFKPLPTSKSGLFAWENAKDLALVHLGKSGAPLLVVANNNSSLQGFRLVGEGKLAGVR
ncbi:MAG: VCBS repeat-containing protein [Flavobacteriales bacterium]